VHSHFHLFPVALVFFFFIYIFVSGDIFSSTETKTLLIQICTAINITGGSFLRGVNWSGCHVNHSPPSGARKLRKLFSGNKGLRSTVSTELEAFLILGITVLLLKKCYAYPAGLSTRAITIV
jgi:hypothetical protein